MLKKDVRISHFFFFFFFCKVFFKKKSRGFYQIFFFFFFWNGFLKKKKKSSFSLKKFSRDFSFVRISRSNSDIYYGMFIASYSILLTWYIMISYPILARFCYIFEITFRVIVALLCLQLIFSFVKGISTTAIPHYNNCPQFSPKLSKMLLSWTCRG
jgi:hypothetical protein